MTHPEYIGIDLHRRRSVVVRMDAEGQVLSSDRIDNDPEKLQGLLAAAGPDPEVVLEATYGWYWAVDACQEVGARVHLAHPLGVNAFKTQRVKQDHTDARHLADLLRMNRLPEAWIAPPEVLELRELIRYRAKLVALRSNCKSQIHAVLGKFGVKVTMSDLFGVSGLRLLDDTALPPVYLQRVNSLRGLIEAITAELWELERPIQKRLEKDQGYQAIQRIPGVGPVLGAVLVAEIGDVTRFRDAAALCSWAGLTPRHRESDRTVHRGRITKQGSKLVRWATVEAAQRLGGDPHLGEVLGRLRERRGRGIARVAVARRILTLVYYGLRDGEIRALARSARQACQGTGGTDHWRPPNLTTRGHGN